jgi:hypothetical protein
MTAFARLRLLGFVLLAVLPALACKDDRDAGEPEANATDAGAGSGASAGTRAAGTGGSSGSASGGTGSALDAGGTPQPFAPGTFSAEHEAEIRKDCNETLQCLAQQGQQLPDDPMEQCLIDSATVLDEGGAERQANFLSRFNRCSQYVVCDYYNCATSNAGGSP